MAWESVDIINAEKTNNFTDPEYLEAYWEMDRILESQMKNPSSGDMAREKIAKSQTPPQPKQAVYT